MGEGRKDSRRAQPESAGCSACQARGWAGLVMTRPGHCQHCSPCPVQAVIHPTLGQPEKGLPQQSNKGFRASLQGPVSTLLPWTWTLACAPPALSSATTRSLRGSLFVSPTYPHPSLMLCPLRLWLAQKGSQVWTSITREETRLPCLRASPLPAAAPPAWPATTWPGCPLDKANTNGGGQSVAGWRARGQGVGLIACRPSFGEPLPAAFRSPADQALGSHCQLPSARLR